MQQQLVLFQTGSMEFALDRNCISHIRSIPEQTRETRDRIQQQTIEHEGRSLLLIDLAADANQDCAVPHPSDAKMIVVKESPPMALLADHVKCNVETNGEQMDELPPVFAGTARACFPKVLRLEDQLALVIAADALAELGIYADTAPAARQTRPHQNRDKKETFKADNPAHSNPSSTPSADKTLENIVGEKLQLVIGRRVRKTVAETMARTLERHMG